MTRKLRHLSYKFHFRVPGKPGTWHLCFTKTRRVKGVVLVLIHDEFRNEEWIDWETEVEVG